MVNLQKIIQCSRATTSCWLVLIKHILLMSILKCPLRFCMSFLIAYIFQRILYFKNYCLIEIIKIYQTIHNVHFKQYILRDINNWKWQTKQNCSRNLKRDEWSITVFRYSQTKKWLKLIILQNSSPMQFWVINICSTSYKILLWDK